MFCKEQNRFLILTLLLFCPLFRSQTIISDHDKDDDQRSQSSPSNETGLLSNIWNSLTTVNKTSSCPGECVHAITSIFCDNVLEEVSCGGNLFRCCVSNSQYQMLFVTGSGIHQQDSSITDETTPETSTNPPTTTTTTESFSVISNNHHWDMTTPHKTVLPTKISSLVHQLFTSYSQAENPTTQSTTTTTTTESTPSLFYGNFESGRNDMILNTSSNIQPCPVQCTSKTNSFCMRPMKNGHCSLPDEECCLEQESTLDTMTKNFIKLVQQTVAMNQTKNIGAEFNAIQGNNGVLASTTTTTSTMSPLAPCDGTCVVPLFHMLCDEIDHNQYCAHGYCCVNREPSTVAPQITSCDGTCLPVILSGMCTKPYELVLKTIECGAGTICCAHGKNMLDNLNINNNQPSFNEQNIDVSDSNNKPSFLNQPSMLIPPSLANYPPSPPVLPIPPRVPIQSKPVPPVIPSPYSPVRNNQPPPLILENKVHFRPPPNLKDNTKPSPVNESPENVSPAMVPSVVEPNFIQKEIFGCPGKCINSMFKFTCLGGYSIYKHFKCSKGQLCCASNVEIEKFEIFLHNTKLAQQQLNQQQQTQSGKPIGNPIENKLPIGQSQATPVIIPGPIINSQQHPTSTNNDNTLELSPVPMMISGQQPQPAVVSVTTSIPSPNVCGVKGGSKRTGRVVGGSDSYPGEWCWQVALVNQQNKYICGGALIGKQWALTAAHCVTNYARKNEPIFVRVGEYDLTRNNRFGQTQKVSTIYVHHNHNSQSLDNDIALLKLQSSIDLNANTCLVCLPTNSDRRRGSSSSSSSSTSKPKRCTVTGYGFQHESGPIALRIREAQVPIVDDQECITRINSVTEKLFILPASSFCAGGKGGNDACQGDGGSGLVCESDGFYELTGLVSWGFGCGRNGVPGVYVKVSTFVGWINQIVSTNTN